VVPSPVQSRLGEADATAIWNEMLPAETISDSDRHHIDLLWSGKYPKSAELELKLKRNNPAEHERLRRLGQLCGVVPEDRAIPTYSGPSMTPSNSRYGSPAAAEEERQAQEKMRRLDEMLEAREKKDFPHRKR